MFSYHKSFTRKYLIILATREHYCIKETFGKLIKGDYKSTFEYNSETNPNISKHLFSIQQPQSQTGVGETDSHLNVYEESSDCFVGSLRFRCR